MLLRIKFLRRTPLFLKSRRSRKPCQGFHLLIRSGSLIQELMITEGNKQKRQSQFGPAFFLLELIKDLLLKFLPESPKTK
jgi:hypothetical protein